jgi:hypothetical protein
MIVAGMISIYVGSPGPLQLRDFLLMLGVGGLALVGLQSLLAGARLGVAGSTIFLPAIPLRSFFGRIDTGERTTEDLLSCSLRSSDRRTRVLLRFRQGELLMFTVPGARAETAAIIAWIKSNASLVRQVVGGDRLLEVLGGSPQESVRLPSGENLHSS